MLMACPTGTSVAPWYLPASVCGGCRLQQNSWWECTEASPASTEEHAGDGIWKHQQEGRKDRPRGKVRKPTHQHGKDEAQARLAEEALVQKEMANRKAHPRWKGEGDGRT